MDQVMDEVLNVLEEADCTVADALAILEICKYNLLRATETELELRGATIQ